MKAWAGKEGEVVERERWRGKRARLPSPRRKKKERIIGEKEVKCDGRCTGKGVGRYGG